MNFLKTIFLFATTVTAARTKQSHYGDTQTYTDIRHHKVGSHYGGSSHHSKVHIDYGGSSSSSSSGGSHHSKVGSHYGGSSHHSKVVSLYGVSSHHSKVGSHYGGSSHHSKVVSLYGVSSHHSKRNSVSIGRPQKTNTKQKKRRSYGTKNKKCVVPAWPLLYKEMLPPVQQVNTNPFLQPAPYCNATDIANYLAGLPLAGQITCGGLLSDPENFPDPCDCYDYLVPLLNDTDFVAAASCIQAINMPYTIYQNILNCQATGQHLRGVLRCGQLSLTGTSQCPPNTFCMEIAGNQRFYNMSASPPVVYTCTRDDNGEEFDRVWTIGSQCVSNCPYYVNHVKKYPINEYPRICESQSLVVDVPNKPAPTPSPKNYGY